MDVGDPASRIFPQVTARDLALILFKRKWGITMVTAVTMVTFLVWLFLIRSDRYQVTVKVLVKIGREQAPPPSVMGASPLVVAYRSQDVNSEIDIFQNGESIAKVVDELGLDQPFPQPEPKGFLARLKYESKKLSRWLADWYEEVLIRLGMRERLTPKEKAIFALKRYLTVRSQRDSNVIVAELYTPYRVGSARVLNALLDQYLIYRQNLFQSKEAGFFRSAVEDNAARLHDAEEAIQRFENEGGISEITKQESVLLEHVAAARAAWKEMDYARAEMAGRVERLEQELAADEPNFAAVAEFGREGFQTTVLDQLADLQREREKLRMTELDTGDKVQNNRQQFRALADMLSASLRAALAERTEQTILRRSAYDALQEELGQLHAKQMQLVELKRAARDYENTYLLYRKKLEEASVDDALLQQRIGNVAVVERAMDPLAPAGVRKTTLLGLALLGAILAALSWVTVAEFFDHRIYSVEELQRQVGVPILAAVSHGVRLENEKLRREVKPGTPRIHGA